MREFSPLKASHGKIKYFYNVWPNYKVVLFSGTYIVFVGGVGIPLSTHGDPPRCQQTKLSF